MTTRCRAGRPTNGDAGFTLIELAIVLTILGIVISMSVEFAGSYLENQRRQETLIKLDTIEQALVLYAAQNRRLPCAADGTAGLDGTGAGVEAPLPHTGTCTSDQNDGVVPWRTLGLPTDAAIDGWGTMITYRAADTSVTGGAVACGSENVAPTETDGLLLSNCDPSNSTQMNGRLTGVGLAVALTATPADNQDWLARPSERTGAAYVLISHGPNGAGGYLPSGNTTPETATGAEVQNQNNQNLRMAESDPYVETHDDILRFATVAQLAIKAKLQPR